MLKWAGWVAIVLVIVGAWAWGQGLNRKSGPWALQESGTTAGLRGVYSLGGGVAWASGTNGTVLRTEDGGYEWQSCTVPDGGEKLDFRGIVAWDSDTAMVMSSGTGDLSRLYRTTDGCSHWKLIAANPDKDGFWDAMVFVDKANGYLLGDPVDGAFPLLRTADGGVTWTKIQSPGLATGSLSIAAFAASNSALIGSGQLVNALLAGDGRVWFGTGGKDGAYLYEGESSCDRDGSPAPDPACLNTWNFQRKALPLAGGSASAGVFSLRVVWWDETVKAGVAVGGDYAKPNDTEGTAAWTPDGVKWSASEKPPHGYRSAVAWDAEMNGWIAVGSNGSDVSYNGGRTWKSLDDGNWNALSLPFVVGPGGKIGKINLDDLHK